MFALGLVPMIGVAGAAVDYSRANATRTAMQATLDSTALMVACLLYTSPSPRD